MNINDSKIPLVVSYPIYLRVIKIFYFLFAFSILLPAQDIPVPSSDTSGQYVKELWQTADRIFMTNPAEAIKLATKSYQVAKASGDLEGVSRSLGILANTYGFLGNYEEALTKLFEKLKLEEKRGNQRNLASALINIGVIYSDQEDFENSMKYFNQAGVVINIHKVNNLKDILNVNKGTLYLKLKEFKKAEDLFNTVNLSRDSFTLPTFKSTAQLGLAHVFFETNQYDSSAHYYTKSISELSEKLNIENLIEAKIGMAKLKDKEGKIKEALNYAYDARIQANSARALKLEANVVKLISEIYAKHDNYDSAYVYLAEARKLDIDIFSKDKIRNLELLSINEDLRQLEREEEIALQKKQRKKQLQFIFITIFIPTLFALSLLLRRRKASMTVIRLLGVVSLMFAFEFLTLLLHPLVAELTHHNPVLEILIFVVLGFILVPGHHRLEKLMMETIFKNRLKNENENFKEENVPEDGLDEIKKESL